MLASRDVGCRPQAQEERVQMMVLCCQRREHPFESLGTSGDGGGFRDRRGGGILHAVRPTISGQAERCDHDEMGCITERVRAVTGQDCPGTSRYSSLPGRLLSLSVLGSFFTTGARPGRGSARTIVKKHARLSGRSSVPWVGCCWCRSFAGAPAPPRRGCMFPKIGFRIQPATTSHSVGSPCSRKTKLSIVTVASTSRSQR